METKYYYSYNTEEKAFSGKYPAIKNPRRQSEYLLPAMATFKEPPITNENEVAIWDGNDWVVEPDYRGEKQVEIKTKLISNIEYVGKIKAGFQRVSDAIAGDIVGLYDTGNFQIGDSIYAGKKKIVYPELPQFTPEIFMRVTAKNVMKQKSFHKGMNQLVQEGAIQLYRNFYLHKNHSGENIRVSETQ